MFEPFTTAEDSVAAIQEFLRGEDGRALPQDVQDKAWSFLLPGGPAGTSVSFTVAYFVELMYARKKDVPNSALKLAARCAAYGQMYSVDNLGGERGSNIMQALRRKSGEKAPTGMSWPAAADDPDARDEFISDADRPAPPPEPTPVEPDPALQP